MRRVHIVPTPTGTEVRAVPDPPPAAARRPAGRPAAPHGGRPGLRPVPARRAAGRGRGLPGGAAARGRAAAAAGGQRAHRGGAVVHAARRVLWWAARPWCATRSSACGWATATAGAMPVGYLPDMFGRGPDAPDPGRLRSSTRWWRGVPRPSTAAGSGEAPDGTTVRAEYMPQGYGNGSALPDDAKVFVEAVAGFAETWRDLLAGPVLWMNGTDHQLPSRGAGWWPRPTTSRTTTTCASSLAEHLAAAPTDGLATWSGELRSGARANLLMGWCPTGSTCAASARAERAAGRGRAAVGPVPAAGPLARRPAGRGVAGRRAQRGPRLGVRLLDRRRVRRGAHPLPGGRRHRRGPGRPLLTHLAARVDHDGPLVVNPTARPRDGLVEVVVPGTEAPAGISCCAPGPARRRCTRGRRRSSCPRPEVDWIRPCRPSRSRTRTDRAGGERAPGPRSSCPPRSVRRSTPCGPGTGRLRLTVRQPEQVTVLAHVAGVPGFGWRCWSPGDGRRGPGDGHRAGRGCGRRHLPGPGQRRGDRGRRPRRRHLRPGRTRRAGRLVDGGDCGDTYNWCPPTTDTVVDAPESVDVRVLERGLLRARVLVTIRYRWPAGREASTAVAPPPSTTRCARCSSCGPARLCASRCASTTPAATTGCGPTSLPLPP